VLQIQLLSATKRFHHSTVDREIAQLAREPYLTNT